MQVRRTQLMLLDKEDIFKLRCGEIVTLDIPGLEEGFNIQLGIAGAKKRGKQNLLSSPRKEMKPRVYVPLEDVYKFVDKIGKPIKTQDVADALNISRFAAYEKCLQLEKAGRFKVIKHKVAGAGHPTFLFHT